MDAKSSHFHKPIREVKSNDRMGEEKIKNKYYGEINLDNFGI